VPLFCHYFFAMKPAKQENNNNIVPIPLSNRSEKLQPGVALTLQNGREQYVCTYFIDGKKKRKFFNKKTNANAHAKHIANCKKKSIAQLNVLSVDVQIDILNAYKRATRGNYSLLEACERFERVGDIRPSITFKKAAQVFLEAKKSKNCRPRTIQTYKYIIKPFELFFADVNFNEISSPDVLEWLISQPIAPRTYNNYLTNLSTVYNWVKSKNYAVTKNNPFSIEQKLLDELDPAILEVDEIQEYAEKACEIQTVGLVVVLVLFCGLRVEEACQTSIGDIKLNRSNPIIRVSGQIAKLRNKRNIRLLPNAIEWIKYAIKQGCQLPVSHDQFFLNRKRKMKRIGSNALRHSFCSYHLAKFENKNETAYLAGNSPDVIDTNYKELIDIEDAEEFWQILPPS